MADAAHRPGLGTGQGVGTIDPLAPSDAARRILAEVAPQPPLRIPLDDALGCVLAEAIVSPLDVPARTNSAMDGYAARAADVRGATRDQPRVLRVVEVIPAGAFPTRALGPGQCARIFTGAPLPDGADSVIRQEDTAPLAADHPAATGDQPAVAIHADRDAGQNIRRAGEDIRRGERVLEAGTELGPAHLGVLAALAVAHPLVHRRPRVAILGSGDEIVDLDRTEEILSGRKTASSNTHTLLALIRSAGGIPVNLGIASDTVQSLRDHLRRGRDCDLLVTTAGVSVGEHDQLRAAVLAEGGELRFWRIRMRPGAPVAYGRLYGLPWIGLPGNPVSTMVTFELLVRPVIRRMLGHTLLFRAATPVRVAERIVVKPRLQHFLRAVVTPSRAPDLPAARLAGPQGSGILTSMVRANALLVIPEGQLETPEGAVANALLFDQTRHGAEPPW